MSRLSLIRRGVSFRPELGQAVRFRRLLLDGRFAGFENLDLSNLAELDVPFGVSFNQ